MRFFFFKQKTAYEMRISDWSSDVCSSDLKTTGFLVMRGGRTLAEENWPAPDDRMFAIFLYGKAADGALFEDVASQQKSFVSVLVGVAIDKGLLDVDKPVSEIGRGSVRERVWQYV